MSWGKKVFLITLDGIADRPSKELDGRTPLEIAQTPHLDRLAKEGINGLMHPLSPGVPMPTDVAHYLVFGYAPEERPGRSVFEATGYGVTFSPDEVICSTSFALVEPEGNALKIMNRRELGLSADEGRCCVEAVSHYRTKEFEFEVVYTKKHFGILKIRGPASDQITDSDPFYSKLPVVAIQPLNDSLEAAKTTEALNEYLRWTYTVLSKLSSKINILLTKWPGRHSFLMPFSEKYGMRGLSLSPKELLNGLASYLGLETVYTGNLYETSRHPLEAGLSLVLERLEHYDFIHVHDPRPDVISHKKDPTAKTKVIEQLDTELGILVNSLSDDWVVCVTTDHATPSTVGVGKAMHAGEPVPVTIWGAHTLSDSCERFSERSAAHGALGLVLGKDLMMILMNYADRLGNYGFRPRPVKNIASFRPKPEQIKPLSPP
jgi:2,3-bisphosphoglycerate-independent phosphoglycerate mutase